MEKANSLVRLLKKIIKKLTWRTKADEKTKTKMSEKKNNNMFKNQKQLTKVNFSSFFFKCVLFKILSLIKLK